MVKRKKIKNLNDIISIIANNKNVLITAIGQTVSTFSEDNMKNFEPWILLQRAKLNNDLIDKIIVIIREFIDEKQDSSCEKTLCGFLIIRPNSVIPLKSKEMEKAFCTDAETGKDLAPEPNLTFLNFEDWLSSQKLYN